MVRLLAAARGAGFQPAESWPVENRPHERQNNTLNFQHTGSAPVTRPQLPDGSAPRRSRASSSCNSPVPYVRWLGRREKIGGVELSDGSLLPSDFRIDGGPSCLFDAVAIVASDEGAAKLAGMTPAQDLIRDAFVHLKAIAFTANTSVLFTKAGLAAGDMDEACITLAKKADADTFIKAASAGKFWKREPKLRPLP